MIQKYNYNGTSITFNTDNGLMVNATEMAKAFGKRVPEWTRLQSAKDFLDELWSIRNSNGTVVQKMHYDIHQTDDLGLQNIMRQFDKNLHLIVTSSGGQMQGTWMHEDVALEFARWLSPSFAIWCNDRIKEIITAGKTTVDFSNPKAVLQLAQNWADEQERRIEAEKQIELKNEQLLLQENTIHQQAPKVEYTDKVLQSESLINTNVIAKELGMSAVSLNKILHEKGIQYKSGGVWVLYEKYQNKGYTKTKTHTYTDVQGNQQTAIHTYFTESGRQFIHQLFNRNLKIQND